MINENNYFMERAIELLEVSNKGFSVAMILVFEDSIVFQKSYCDLKSRINALIMEDIKKINKKNINKLFLTVNLINGNNEFLLNEILLHVNVSEIFLGLADPEVNTYISSDPVLRLDNIESFPDYLQRRVIDINSKYYLVSEQNIKKNIYYHENRISSILLDELNKHGISISKKELLENKTIAKLVNYISDKYNLSHNEIEELLNDILSFAFNKKYSKYDYTNDARGINLNWKESFFNICSRVGIENLNNKKILNVGVGSGNEAKELFLGCKNITFIDIAEEGLKKIKNHFKFAEAFVCNAEKLDCIDENTLDIYISLRTYNSSFFDKKNAISEAKRVLKSEGVLIISLANAFLNIFDSNLIPGLIIPGTDFVDIYRAYFMIKDIEKILKNSGFLNINIDIADTEIYITSKKGGAK